MIVIFLALLLAFSTIAEASYSIGDEPISRANLDTEPSYLVWYAFSTDTVVMSVATKVELYQNKTGPVHIGLWLYNGDGAGYVNGFEFDFPTPGYHSITLTRDQYFLIQGYSFISVMYQSDSIATIPYDTVSCHATRYKAFWTSAIPTSNLIPFETYIEDTNEQNDCRAYSAKIELEPACTPGHFSWNMTAPCEECATNFYQGDYGASECIRCPSGHITDGPGTDSAEECYPAPGGDLDPHFMISNHNNEHFCFDYVGRNEEIITLVEDQKSGILIQGQLFGASPTDATVTYFANFVILHPNGEIHFTREELSIGVQKTSWTRLSDVTDDDSILSRPNPENEAVLVNLDDVSVVITRHTGKIGYYLGIYLANIQGISDEADGILGKFMHDDFVHTEENGKHFIIHQLADGEVKVAVHLLERFSPSTTGSFMCYVADDSEEMLNQIAPGRHQTS